AARRAADHDVVLVRVAAAVVDPLFPYPTLFRSVVVGDCAATGRALVERDRVAALVDAGAGAGPGGAGVAGQRRLRQRVDAVGDRGGGGTGLAASRGPLAAGGLGVKKEDGLARAS